MKENAFTGINGTKICHEFLSLFMMYIMPNIFRYSTKESITDHFTLILPKLGMNMSKALVISIATTGQVIIYYDSYQPSDE